MKKCAKGEVVLSAGQYQASRLNKLEHRRLQRRINFLHRDYKDHITRICRQEQNLKHYFTNVVQVVKPNREYEIWKEKHASEIAQDEANELAEANKRKRRLNEKRIREEKLLSHENQSTSNRPLLVLVEPTTEKSSDIVFDLGYGRFRPKTSPINRQFSRTNRINPLLSMLEKRPNSSNNLYRFDEQQQTFDSPSCQSSSSMGSKNPQKLIHGKFIATHKESDLDALYRIALQNQTAYKSVETNIIEERKLHDKLFASRHRALQGSMRSAACVALNE